MKSLSADSLASIISRSIDAMATGKKTTVGYRTIVLVAIGALLGNVVDVKGSLAPMAKLPTMLQVLENQGKVIENQGTEIKELRRLREEDHRLREEDHKSIEDIRAILKRAGLAIIQYLDLNQTTAGNNEL